MSSISQFRKNKLMYVFNVFFGKYVFLFTFYYKFINSDIDNILHNPVLKIE